MKNKIKIIIASFIIINTSIFLYFSLGIPRIFTKEKPSYLAAHNLDITKTLQYGEYLSDIQIKDRYNNEFNLNDYKDKPVLFLFLKKDIKTISDFNDSLKIGIMDFISKGLNLVYISIDSNIIDNFDHLNNKSKIFYDTDSMDFHRKFKTRECCGSIVLIDKGHNVILNTLISLKDDKISEIIHKNKNLLF